jgi:hypothetical protein
MKLSPLDPQIQVQVEFELQVKAATVAVNHGPLPSVVPYGDPYGDPDGYSDCESVTTGR